MIILGWIIWSALILAFINWFLILICAFFKSANLEPYKVEINFFDFIISILTFIFLTMYLF